MISSINVAVKAPYSKKNVSDPHHYIRLHHTWVCLAIAYRILFYFVVL